MNSNKKYDRTVMFSGADLNIYIGSKEMCGISSFVVDEEKNTITLGMPVSTTFIDELNFLKTLKNENLYEIYLDEYGNKMYRKFSGLDYCFEKFAMDVNQINPRLIVILNYHKDIDHNPYNSFDLSIIDLVRSLELESEN